ncbi:MAG: hypothetical protein Q7S83_02905 [bacterium]|nr:hypothetical protein [bacterium]
MKKNLVLILVAVALIVLGFWYWNSVKEEAAPLSDDNSSAINAELNGVDLGDLDAEFKDIEAELGTL